jgi:hypothetical protein
MKGKLSPIYYIIPVLYIGVIIFFVFMQFQAREEFSEKVGSLVLSGVYAKALGGGQRMRHLEVQFHDLRMDFSQSSGLIAGFGATRESKLAVDSFSQFPDGFEVVFSDDAALRFVVEGVPGDRVLITPIIPRRLRGMRSLSLPFRFEQGTVDPVRGIPLLAHQGPAGVVYVSLGSGSQIDVQQGRFVLGMENNGPEQTIVLERVLEEPDPYLYWFSRNVTLAGRDEFEAMVETYLDSAYRYWTGIFVGNPGSPELIGELGISLLSETIKRGDYRRTLAVLSRNLRQLLRENADNPALHSSAVYLGNLPSFLAARQEAASRETERITDLIRGADFSVFEIPQLLCFILNHAPFSLAEEVLRLADSVQLERAEADTLIHLVNVYLEAVEYLDVGEATSARIAEIVDRFILPEIEPTAEGLFLSTRLSNRVLEADLYESILTGRTLMEAGRSLLEDSYTPLGRSLLYSALGLADSKGFLPKRVRIQDGEAVPVGGTLSPQEIYELLPGRDYTPDEYPLYPYLYPGSWIWTASQVSEVKIEDNQYRFFFSFPLGQTHYLLIQGIRPMTSITMHGIPWKSDPEYFRYTDGWAYDQDTQTLYVKLTHRVETEELVLNY